MSESNIYLIQSNSRQDLAETFMRFQEYYESPVFAGRAFTVEEFAHWYAGQWGSFSYSRDWSGFNIPSWVLEPFFKGNFDPLTTKEQRLISFFNKDRQNNKNFYVIGATPQDDWFKETVKHEFVHGAFFTSPEYKKEVIETIRAQKSDTIKTALIKMGYGKSVLDDEANAYLLTEPETMGREVALRDGAKLRDMLDKVFFKYFGFSMVKAPIENVLQRVKNYSI